MSFGQIVPQMFSKCIVNLLVLSSFTNNNLSYNKQLALKAISKDEKFRWCTCGHGQIHGPGGEYFP